MTSLWLANRVESETPPGSWDAEPKDFDVAVIGAGITGLVTAVLLARAGKRVAVLEARYVGAGTTGHTTGKVSLLQGAKLSRISAKHGDGVLRAYVTGNQEGSAWLLRHCADRGLDVAREDAFSYAQTADGVDTARAELDACRAGGLDVRWVPEADVPFPYHGGVCLPDQAQLDPMPLLDSLVAELESHGGSLFQGVRATSVHGNPLRIAVQTAHYTDDVEPRSTSLTAKQCVLATGVPILDRGLFFARVKAQRSYCLAFDVPGDLTRAMFLSVDSPSRSVRYATTTEGEKLVVGGAGHQVGHGASAAAGVAELRRWTQLHFPGAVESHRWSAQDYSPIDELPYVGPILPGSDTIYVATGFDKWGMTNGVAAALSLSAHILGGRMDWSSAFASWNPHEASGIPSAIRANLEVGVKLATGWVTPLFADGRQPSDGQGVVIGPPWNLRATSVVDGVERTTSPVCPHLGGVVRWNDEDLAWECPLHGSRFGPDGALLEGPATRGLSTSCPAATAAADAP